MACNQVIIVYSPNQNVRRRVVKPDFDSQIPGLIASHLPGEAYLIVSQEDYDTYGPDALVGWETMSAPSSDHCMIVRNGVLLHARVLADPQIDTYPDAEVVIHSVAVSTGRASGVAVL